MFLFICVYGRLILWPRLTEVRENFTHGVSWVSLEKLLLGFFLVLLKLQGGPKRDEIWRIFRPHPQTFCSHARMRQNIVILKKTCEAQMVALHVMPRLVNFVLQTPEIHATQNSLKMTRVNSSRHVLFPFAICQHDHARTSYDTVIACPMLCPNPLTPWPFNLDP